MKRVSTLVTALILCTAALEAQAPRVVRTPESYGPDFQDTHVGAAAFHGNTPQAQYVFQTFTSGYLESNTSSGSSYQVYNAPLSLPDGAEIHGLCLYADDTNPDSGVLLKLKATRLVPLGITPGADDVTSYLVSDWSTGAGVICADVVPPYVYREKSDEDGVFLAHYFEALLYPSTGIGGVKVIWRRIVSPPPAVATFPDVPTSHPFFQFVEALYAAGITAGYGNGNFGVNDPITRGQMAVFLSKALGLHWN